MMKARLWPTTKYARTAPAANSGAAMATKTYAHLRSCRCRPGAMNAHSWYSQTGAPTMIPTQSAILSAQDQRVADPEGQEVALPVVSPELGSAQ